MTRFASRLGVLSIASLLLLLAGCSAGDASLGEAGEELVVCPAGPTVKGVDVSVYQGNIDWPAVKAAGIDFAIARVSDGTFQDTKFAQNWSGMKSAGIIRGAYQFFRPDGDPLVQAQLMIQKVGVLTVGDLPCTADVEVVDGVGPATYAANLKTWVDKVTAGTGKAPMIYVGKYFWNGNVKSSAFNQLPLWIAAWGPPCPDLPDPWSNWAFWQTSDMGSVNGIPATVDLDEFNGDLAKLDAFAGQAPSYAAKYVSQSFPLASMPLVMTVNQSIPSFIELKNVGGATWDGNTHLGTTQPRDRQSEFSAPDWLNPGRPSGVMGTVPPGQSYKFGFTLHAPEKPGTYFEYFGVVEDGVHWFSDQGQGGPPDNQLEAQIEVVEAEYHGQFVKQSYPTLQDPALRMEPGEAADGWIELKNVGTATWKAGETKLAPTPRDMGSPLGGADWMSPTRVSTLGADVPPGSIGHFSLSLKAGAPGDYTQTFSLVEEGVTWFADAPKGGGPADDLLAVHVVVPGAGSGAGGGGGGGGGGGSGGPVNAAGCACRAASAGGGSEGLGPWLGALGAVWVMRRRRGRARI